MNLGDEASEQNWSLARGMAVLLVLGFFLFSLRPHLGPVVLYLVLLALLVPARGVSSRSLLIGATTGLAMVWLLLSAGSVLAPFLVALALAYLLDPAVDHLQRRGLGRSLAILLLVGPVIVGVAVGAVFGLPALWDQVSQLIRRAPALLERVAEWAATLETDLTRLPWIGQAIREGADQIDADAIVETLEAGWAEWARRGWSGVLGVGRGIGSVISLAGYVILTPVLAFYLLRDWDTIVQRTQDLIPRSRKATVSRLVAEYDELLGRYLRGQITVALLMGALTALGLWIWGFPYAFLVGTLVAVFSVVPYLGLLLSLLPAVVIALLSGSVGYSLLKVAVVFAVVQGLEGTVISPRIVGDSVGIHPVWIVLAITAGGFFFGFVGLLLAVPAATGVKILLVHGLNRYRASDAYQGTGGEEPG